MIVLSTACDRVERPCRASRNHLMYAMARRRASRARHRHSRERKLDGISRWSGFMGAGKSSIGGRLAERLGRPFYDSDASVEKLTGSTVQELFRLGRSRVQGPKPRSVREIVAGPPACRALGGGALQDTTTRALLRSACFVVHLYLELGRRSRGATRTLRRPPPIAAASRGDPSSSTSSARGHTALLHVRIDVPRDDVEQGVRSRHGGAAADRSPRHALTGATRRRTRRRSAAARSLSARPAISPRRVSLSSSSPYCRRRCVKRTSRRGSRASSCSRPSRLSPQNTQIPASPNVDQNSRS